jgi:hypothetical protein
VRSHCDQPERAGDTAGIPPDLAGVWLMTRRFLALPIGLILLLATPAAAQRQFPGDEDLMTMLR